MTDDIALANLQSGDQRALEWFIDKYSAHVGTIVKNILQNSMSQSDIEEVTADVFFTLWKSKHSLYPGNSKGYLSRVARSLSMKKLRDCRQELPLEDDILILEEDSLIEKLEKSERDSIVREAVLSMPQPDREIFLRFYYYCQSVSVIAEKMKINSSTIKTRLKRGREKLRQQLGGFMIGGE